MPELDFALIADYVRSDAGVAHVIGAGIDTIWAPAVPSSQAVGLLTRFAFSRPECGRPHRIEVLFQGEDGERLAQLATVVTPEWKDELPAHWRVSLMGGFNMPVPLPQYGLYSFEIMLNDNNVKTIQLRVMAPPSGDQAGEAAPTAEPDNEA